MLHRSEISSTPVSSFFFSPLKKNYWKRPSSVDETDRVDLKGRRGTAMAEYQKVVEELRTLRVPEAQKALIETATEMPATVKKEVVEALGGTLGPPNDDTRNFLWKLVVSAFVIVLVGSFGTLAWAVFNPPVSEDVKPEIILSLFTSVVGFLAGLFVPSPAKS